MEITKDKYDKLGEVIVLFNKNPNYELEAKYKETINKDIFTKFIQYCRSMKYKEDIQPEVLDISVISRLQDKEISYRISLKGQDAITEYCKTNILQESLHGNNLQIITKKPVKGISSILFNDLSFKVDLKEEVPISSYEILKQLPLLNKTFRYKKRFSYTTGHFKYDLTIVRSSVSKGKNLIESNLTNSPEIYEIEIELVKPFTKDIDKIVNDFLRIMISSYTIIQGDQHMITKTEKSKVLSDYLKLAFKYQQAPRRNKKYTFEEDANLNPKQYFIGPQPITLERNNLVAPELGVVTILDNYTVTDKADGERCLLYINGGGRCYLINNRLSIQYTGLQVNSAKNCIFDGEYITKDILGNNIKLYAMFDAYIINDGEIRQLPLMSESVGVKTRFKAMKDFETKNKTSFNSFLKVKDFYMGDIFAMSKKIYDGNIMANNVYHIDGLIYTPANLAVGASFEDDTPNNLGSWSRVFKWKPPEENTIDFLVKYEKDQYGKVFKVIREEDGKLVNKCNLYVGYDPIQWEPITAYKYLNRELNRKASYYARTFLPPDVTGDTFSQYSGDICKNGDVIHDNTIVEFAYESGPIGTPVPKGGWMPLRERKDKTEALRKYGLGNTANDYKTALNVWRSISDPVTYRHIIGEDQLDLSGFRNEDIYYYRSVRREKMASRNMMNFHNWVKNTMLMQPISMEFKLPTLMDLACGKAGDLGKWIDNKYAKVFGVDIMRDNIENPIDGAYARTFENYKKPAGSKYVYLTMNSSEILDVNKITNERDRYVADILWGTITKGEIKEEYLKEYHGYVRDFDVVSCQFALHYFYESQETLSNFLDNINTYLKDGGYFIGTCLDGNLVKNKLKGLKYGEEIKGEINKRVIWNIKKLYKTEKNSISQEIEIYMESIGKRIKEYLVNMDLLINKLKEHDIHLIEMENFGVAYNKSEDKNLTDIEKAYSFMNIYFIFKKGLVLADVTKVVVDEPDVNLEAESVVKKPKAKKPAKLKKIEEPVAKPLPQVPEAEPAEPKKKIKVTLKK